MKTPSFSRRYIVRGSVQGVGYRYFAQKKALELKLVGIVRNLDDGSVEVIATGTADQLSRLARDLHVGPPSAQVRRIEEQKADVQQYDSFSIQS